MDVRTQCLGLLMRGPASGYELRKRVEEGPFCRFLEASFASIYPALSRLTKDGLIVATAHPQANRPDKKVYEITAKGRDAFLAAIAGPLEDDTFRSPWFVAMSFAELLPEDRRRELIAERIAACLSLLDKIDQGAAQTPGEEFVAGMGVRILRAELDYLRTIGTTLSSGPIAPSKRKPVATPLALTAEALEL